MRELGWRSSRRAVNSGQLSEDNLLIRQMAKYDFEMRLWMIARVNNPNAVVLRHPGVDEMIRLNLDAHRAPSSRKTSASASCWTCGVGVGELEIIEAALLAIGKIARPYSRPVGLLDVRGHPRPARPMLLRAHMVLAEGDKGLFAMAD